jgi:hypothetical protein
LNSCFSDRHCELAIETKQKLVDEFSPLGLTASIRVTVDTASSDYEPTIRSLQQRSQRPYEVVECVLAFRIVQAHALLNGATPRLGSHTCEKYARGAVNVNDDIQIVWNALRKLRLERCHGREEALLALHPIETLKLSRWNRHTRWAGAAKVRFGYLRVVIVYDVQTTRVQFCRPI